MAHPQLIPSQLHSQLQELEDDAEKLQVKLTEDVRQYIRTHLEAVQNKLVNGEPIFEEDMEFMREVRMWVAMPEEWREKYPSAEEMKKADEVQDAFQEFQRRHISLHQWLDLLHVAEAKEEKKEWIDETFEFPGAGKIKVEENLNLVGCPPLTSLPEGLSVGGSLNLKDCASLTSLPDGLSVRGYLDLTGCTSLTSLPDGLSVRGDLYLENCTSLTSLPDGLSVRGFLNLENCTSLTSLPDELSVGENLDLRGCTSLTSLPEGLLVGMDLWFSEDLNEQVKKDAERLKTEGKIKGEIEYK